MVCRLRSHGDPDLAVSRIPAVAGKIAGEPALDHLRSKREALALHTNLLLHFFCSAVKNLGKETSTASFQPANPIAFKEGEGGAVLSIAAGFRAHFRLIQNLAFKVLASMIGIDPKITRIKAALGVELSGNKAETGSPIHIAFQQAALPSRDVNKAFAILLTATAALTLLLRNRLDSFERLCRHITMFFQLPVLNLSLTYTGTEQDYEEKRSYSFHTKFLLLVPNIFLEIHVVDKALLLALKKVRLFMKGLQDLLYLLKVDTFHGTYYSDH
jgi:hypothetical protein